MPNVKISELPAAASVSTTDVIIVNQGVDTKKATVAQALVGVLTTAQIAGLSTSAPAALATAPVVGLSTFAARGDHQHEFPTAAQVGALGATASAGGDLTGNYPNPTLAAITTAQSNVGSSTAIPVISTDAKGRITALSSVQFAALTTNQIAGLSTSAPAALATAPVVGLSPFAARGDHQHIYPTLGELGAQAALTTSAPLALTLGGTGQISRQAAMDALAGAVTAGQYLRGNGTDVVMSAIQAGDVPTLNQNTTGTAANVTGTVAIANGGTGQTTAAAALAALGGVATAVTQVFTSSGTWTKPTGAKSVTVYVIAGGGGGGSGRASASGTAAGGGGGGGGSARTFVTIDAAFLGATETVTVGAGGLGAIARAVGQDGLTGGNGTPSSFGLWASASQGGGGGAGTTAGGGSAGAQGSRGLFAGAAGAAASAAFGVGGNGNSSNACPSGGAGGGVTAGAPGTPSNGGTGGFQFLYNGGAQSATPVNTAGGSVPVNLPYGGAGGGGGNASTSAAANAGGNGGDYGGGGGGGGGGQSFNSGAGGNGGNGIVVVTTYF